MLMTSKIIVGWEGTATKAKLMTIVRYGQITENQRSGEEERGKEVNKVDVCHKAKVEPKGVDQLPLPPLFSQKLKKKNVFNLNIQRFL